ncbi:glycosyltransferase [Clostridium cuniculi]|uniref:glycosyltransferase n=1 Tax=Clostridium cuniculi TaxID=2548455 RepID=UPI001054AAFF|nr:glycosyltransferase [Clostridium cuniculi]
MKKVVHIITGLGNGGAENMLYKLVTNMDSNLYDITVISLRDKGIIGKRLEEKNIEVIALNINNLKYAIKSIKKAKQICKSAEVIQSWMYHADLFGFVIAKIFLKKKIIWGIRHGVLEKGKDRRSTIIIARINAILSRYVDEVVCCSNVSKVYHESIGYKNLKVIPNGFDITYFENNLDDGAKLKQSLCINQNKKVLISIGRWNKAKNYPNLIKAIAILSTKREDFICILVGAGLLENEELLNLISYYGIEKYIRIIGPRGDIPKVLSMGDVFVLHSDIEGFSNALGEAMLSKLFCIATDVGDNEYILNDCGVLVERDNPLKLSEAIMYALNLDEKERKYYSERAKLRIEENFSIQRVSEEFCKLY